MAGREIILHAVFPEQQEEVALKAKTLGLSAQQPDHVRRLGPNYDPAGREMRCGEEIPPYSTVTTRGIEIFAQSFYKSNDDGQNHWV
jgi:hypothetical protein